MGPDRHRQDAQAEIERRSRVMAEAQRFSPYGRPERLASTVTGRYIGRMAEEDGAAALDVLKRRYEGLQVMVTSVRQAAEQARAAGVSWADIGAVVNVSGEEARAMFGGDGEDQPMRDG